MILSTQHDTWCGGVGRECIDDLEFCELRMDCVLCLWRFGGCLEGATEFGRVGRRHLGEETDKEGSDSQRDGARASVTFIGKVLMIGDRRSGSCGYLKNNQSSGDKWVRNMNLHKILHAPGVGVHSGKKQMGRV